MVELPLLRSDAAPNDPPWCISKKNGTTSSLGSTWPTSLTYLGQVTSGSSLNHARVVPGGARNDRERDDPSNSNEPRRGRSSRFPKLSTHRRRQMIRSLLRLSTHAPSKVSKSGEFSRQAERQTAPFAFFQPALSSPSRKRSKPSKRIASCNQPYLNGAAHNRRNKGRPWPNPPCHGSEIV